MSRPIQNAALPTAPPVVAETIRRAPVSASPSRWVQVLSDDPELALPWSRALAAEGLRHRTRGWDADPAAETPRPDAWVVHCCRALPEQLGRLRCLRAQAPDDPLIIVCTALRDLDEVLALEMGADDVLDAAVPAPVVAARLRALWRRCRSPAAQPTEPEQLQFGELWLQRRERRVGLGPAMVPLTEGEFEVLWLLAARAGQAVSRRELVRQIRGLDYQRIDRSIDCRVYRIRRKLGDDDPAQQRIRTVRNRGYLFAASPW